MDCKWVLLYIERWLKAKVQLSTGKFEIRNIGTPQGGVISPLLANIFLHLGFDKWMKEEFPCIHFERYADDIVVHCRSLSQVKFIGSKIGKRLNRCRLRLNQEKTKVSYCKDSNRKGSYLNHSFDFLGYTFRPRSVRREDGVFFVSFSPAVSRNALRRMRRRIREHPKLRCKFQSLEELAKALNPMILGWVNYYGRFAKSAMSPIFDYINTKVMKWVSRKYKNLRKRKRASGKWLRKVAKRAPTLFAHWQHWNWVTE